MTPLQAAVYVASIANNGRFLTPYLVIADPKNGLPGSKTINIPIEYFQIVKEGMRLAVTEGTAQGLNIWGVEVAAKTGTAELESEANKFVNSWLIGFLPYENPKIALAVLLEHGKASNLIGGAFVSRQLIEWMLIHTPEYLTPPD